MEALVNQPESADSRTIQAVVFDAVGTLISPNPSVTEIYRAAVRQFCGIELAAETVRSVIHTALRERSSGGDLRTSERAEHEFWERLVLQLCSGQHDPMNAHRETRNVANSKARECFRYLFEHFGLARHWQVFPDVAETLRRLQNMGIKVAMASNFDQRLAAVCQGLTELSPVSQVFISSAIGYRKPARRFFDAVAQRMDLSPNQILMVGDDFDNDIDGAVRSGFRAAWICRVPADGVLPDGSFLKLSTLSPLPELIRDGKLPDAADAAVPSEGPGT
ncbi:MAG: HAD-IA family hydrolase [Planctomycetaceae bacterium]